MNPFSELPAWRRARGYHVYDEQSRRYLDCWQNGGSALLGHTPPGRKSLIKSEVDRGMTFAGPHRWQPHLEKAVRSLFPEPARWRVVTEDEADELLGKGIAVIWRPLEDDAPEALPDHAGPSHLAFLLPVLPLPGFVRIRLLIDVGGTLSPVAELSSFSSLEAALLTRALWDLRARLDQENPSWESFDLPGFWRRKGPWLYLQWGCRDYKALVNHFREAGILISPDERSPSLLPGEWSEGEKALFEKTAAAAEKRSELWSR